MTNETALTINSAAARAWLFINDHAEVLALGDIEVLRQVSVAQIQTASDVVQALNQHVPFVDGRKTLHCCVGSNAAEQIKRYVDAIRPS